MLKLRFAGSAGGWFGWFEQIQGAVGIVPPSGWPELLGVVEKNAGGEEPVVGPDVGADPAVGQQVDGTHPSSLRVGQGESDAGKRWHDDARPQGETAGSAG